MPRPADTPRDAGYSLTELLVASVLVLLVAGALVALANPAGQAAQAQPEAIDAVQRARFAATSIWRDLHVAGAGLDSGPRTGALSAYFPPVLPRRIGAVAPDAATMARPDAISLIWVPMSPVQTTIAAPFSTTLLVVRDAPGCPIGRPSCGMASGMNVAVFDAAGRFDLFTVENVGVTGVVVRRRGTMLAHTFGDGAHVAEVESRTYYFDPVARQLRQYDTDLTDVPVLDDVVGMRVEYFGLASPPVLPRPSADESNCLYDVGSVPRAGLAMLAAGSDGQAALPLELFMDGPWCGAGDTVYDADLLRVRRVRLTLRVQAASPSLRGTSDRFAIAGSSRSAWRQADDVVVTIDVMPRNLDLHD